jgi:hypothetical protein
LIISCSVKGCFTDLLCHRNNVLLSMESRKVLIFGDKLIGAQPSLGLLYAASKTKLQVQNFLSEATNAVKSQIASLSPEERDEFGSFSNLMKLAQHYDSTEGASLLSGAVLLTVIQVGGFLL